MIPIKLRGRYNKDFVEKINLEECPHILVGGATGSGKSYLLKDMLCDVLECDVSCVVVDPKSVDYQWLEGRGTCETLKERVMRGEYGYGVGVEDIQKRIEMLWSCHGWQLLVREDIESGKVLRVLYSLCEEMSNRYKYMCEYGYTKWSHVMDANKSNSMYKVCGYRFGGLQFVDGRREECGLGAENPKGSRPLVEYESKVWGSREICVFVDELSDLIYADRDKRGNGRGLGGDNKGMIEQMFIKIAMLGRASGIHLVLGTQRPDASVLSGQLRSNIPTRICTGVGNSIERRIILGDSCKGFGERVLFYKRNYTDLE